MSRGAGWKQQRVYERIVNSVGYQGGIWVTSEGYNSLLLGKWCNMRHARVFRTLKWCARRGQDQVDRRHQRVYTPFWAI